MTPRAGWGPGGPEMSTLVKRPHGSEMAPLGQLGGQVVPSPEPDSLLWTLNFRGPHSGLPRP